MKTIFLLMFLCVSLFAFSQQQDVYAEYYSLSTKEVFLTDNYTLLLYDNAIDDSTLTSTSGFQAQLIFVCYTDSLSKVYNNSFYKFDEGIVRFKIWDTMLYGYCYIHGFDGATDHAKVVVTVVGMKNVPQRKKLLFKDSSRLRMWKYPWIGSR